MNILEKKDLRGANLQEVNLLEANLRGANLEGADLEGAQNLSLYQLSKVKTLHAAKLNEDLRIPFKEKYPALFEETK
jgi:uncharacterized protein YjbI with pentapeptide repeats